MEVKINQGVHILNHVGHGCEFIFMKLTIDIFESMFYPYVEDIDNYEYFFYIV
jgi:hypothetical protein